MQYAYRVNKIRELDLIEGIYSEFLKCRVLYTLYTLHSTLYTLHSTLYTLHSTLYTLHSTLYTLHSNGSKGTKVKNINEV